MVIFSLFFVGLFFLSLGLATVFGAFGYSVLNMGIFAQSFFGSGKDSDFGKMFEGHLFAMVLMALGVFASFAGFLVFFFGILRLILDALGGWSP